MANNNAIYNAVVCGATGGIQERWITNQDSAAYAAFKSGIEVIAAIVDGNIPPGVITNSQQLLMQAICQGVFSDRYPQVADYTDIAASIVALYDSLSTSLFPDSSGSSKLAIANWVYYPPTDFPAGVVTQVDCEPLTTAPLGIDLEGAVGGWFGNSPNPGLVVIGAQVDGLGTGMRIFVLNWTASDILGVANVLFTCTYPTA